VGLSVVAIDKSSIQTSIEVFKVEIMDIWGKTVSLIDKNNLTEIQLSMQNQGLYFMKIFTQQGVFLKRFMKY
jgi:hypothetical protein